jgi:NAD(P)-dependent dehydrogenase (short-subunit alcohol dehydrogenase family)
MSIQTTQSRKIAVVSGGSRGIGRSIVLSLARRNVDSIFTYHSNRSEAEKVVTAAAEAGATAVALPLDQTVPSSFEAFTSELRGAL